MANKAPSASLSGFATVPVLDGNGAAYRSSMSSQGIVSALRTHRLSGSSLIPKGMPKSDADICLLRFLCNTHTPRAGFLARFARNPCIHFITYRHYCQCLYGVLRWSGGII